MPEVKLTRRIIGGRRTFVYRVDVSSKVHKYITRGMYGKMPRIVKRIHEAREVFRKKYVSPTATITLKFTAANIYHPPFPN